jgi:hypothetical protein
MDVARAAAADHHGDCAGDVIVDALMVEKGQPLGLTGRFQSIQWAAANAALLLTGVLGGYVAEKHLQSLAFGGCAVLVVRARRDMGLCA